MKLKFIIENNDIKLVEEWHDATIGKIIQILDPKIIHPSLKRLKIYRNAPAHGSIEILPSEKWGNIQIRLWDNFGQLKMSFEELLSNFYTIIKLLDTVYIILDDLEFRKDHDGKNRIIMEYEELMYERKFSYKKYNENDVNNR